MLDKLVSKVKFDLYSHSLKQLVSDTMFLAISQYVFIEMCCILSATIFKGSKVFWLFQEFCLLCLYFSLSVRKKSNVL